MTTATKPCDLCQKQPAQWRWWVRDTRTSPIARLMDLCHECEELDSVHFVTRGNMPIIDADLAAQPSTVAELRTKFSLMFDRLITAAKAEGARDENARFLELAAEAKLLADETPPRKD